MTGRMLIGLFLLVLAAACAGPQKQSPVGEPVAVTIPGAPDAGVKPQAEGPLAVAEPAPGAPAPPAEAAEPTKRERPRSNAGGGPFDRGATAEALTQIDPSICATPGGPRGRGHITITFHPSGNVQSIRLDQPFLGTSSGACIASLYSTLTIPWFSGGPVTVGKSFVIP